MINTNNPAEIIKARVWVNVQSRAIIETAIATTVAIVVPALLAHAPQNQFIVGPIVNAVLFWVALRVGITNALFIAVVPSLIALFRGLLPPTAVTVIPFIVLGNCTMILVFWYLTRLWRVGTGYILFLPITLASLVKTLVIFLPIWLFFNTTPLLSFMMSWPQLATAVVGGVIVILLNKFSTAGEKT